MSQKPDKSYIRKQFLIAQLGDNESTLWQMYINMVLSTTIAKLPPEESDKFKKLIDQEKIDKVLEITEKTLLVADYDRIADIINSEIDRSIDG